MIVRRWLLNLLLVSILLVAGFWNFRQATEAERALCALRHDLELRVERSRDYLSDLDAGRRDPIPGITRTDIVTGIQNQESTINALSNLGCDTT